MNFASMKFFLVGLTLTAMLSACSDDETSDLIPEPSISISALESEIGALNFSINVENAEQCAYVCMNANESLPTTADEIFATGTSIKLTDKNFRSEFPSTSRLHMPLSLQLRTRRARQFPTNYNLPRSKTKTQGRKIPNRNRSKSISLFQQENYFICLTACY